MRRVLYKLFGRAKSTSNSAPRLFARLGYDTLFMLLDNKVLPGAHNAKKMRQKSHATCFDNVERRFLCFIFAIS